MFAKKWNGTYHSLTNFLRHTSRIGSRKQNPKDNSYPGVSMSDLHCSQVSGRPPSQWPQERTQARIQRTALSSQFNIKSVTTVHSHIYTVFTLHTHLTEFTQSVYTSTIRLYSLTVTSVRAFPTWPLLDDSPITHSSRGHAPLLRDRGTFYRGPSSTSEKSGAISDARSLPWCKERDYESSGTAGSLNP